MGTPAEVAATAASLFGSESAFITGSDLLMDGGAGSRRVSFWG
jgi:NAD(P)-dependent dehydrogenase (short-subunit alcohol dehydrogenase family)